MFGISMCCVSLSLALLHVDQVCNVFYTLEVSYTLNVTPEQQKLADGLQGEFCVHVCSTVVTEYSQVSHPLYQVYYLICCIILLAIFQ